MKRHPPGATMSIEQYRALESEDSFQLRVMELAEDNGWRWWHIDTAIKLLRDGKFVGSLGAKDLPDLVLVRERRPGEPPQLIFAELKKASGIVSPGQVAAVNLLLLAGVKAYIWRPDDWGDIVKVLAA